MLIVDMKLKMAFMFFRTNFFFQVLHVFYGQTASSRLVARYLLYYVFTECSNKLFKLHEPIKTSSRHYVMCFRDGLSAEQETLKIEVFI